MSDQVRLAKENMDSAQTLLQAHPIDQDLTRRERDYVVEYVKLAKYEESALKQHSKVKSDLEDNVIDDFSNLRFEAYVKQDDVADLIRPVTREEVILALNSIGSSKAPGPDGFSSHFFKTSLSIVGDDLVAAVQKFFTKSKLLKEINSTFITLIAKSKNPSNVSDYRHISCCNVTYKCITKIISLRMKKILGGLIIQNQSAFISGRSIQDNIMLAHELVRNYHRSKGSPRCALKIDFRKAYDTVKWSAIFYVLKQMGFPDQFINWISLCITSAKFFVLVNGSPYGFFGAKRGLGQGFPISPYLFVLAMEILSATLLKQVQLQNFGFHPRCKLTSLTHLCFVDNVMLFFKGTSSAALSVKNALNEFSLYTGLEMNNQKTSLFYSAIEDDILQQILIILNCSEGGTFCQILSWTYLSHAYEEGGLGVKSLEYTNVAANLRHIWDLISGKETIWTTWVSGLVDSNTLETLGVTDTTKVADFISNGSWNFPSYMEESVQDIVQQITTTDFNIHESDQVFWKDSITGIWIGLLLKLGFIRVPANTWEEEITWCTQNFTGHNTVTTIKKLVLNFFIYHIWKQRNNRIFRSSFNSQDQVSLLIVQEVRYKMSASFCKEEDNVQSRWFMSRWRVDCLFTQPDFIECTWLAPETNETMINTDGSNSDDAGSFGAILRDHNAEVLSDASGDGPSISVLAHELQGVELGMKMAIQLDKFKVHIATDSMAVVNLFTNPEPDPPWNVIQIWRRIKLLKRRFTS
ncbi:uncharacterized protein LOC113312744 [Papaver somniferum]|uniref:uncharacterized protein LOC113312744 n=1 Tax=Papaver somniferum TaxID=3469 RepID=UPI000E6FA6AA|nr:uncharacterized protein LOC113312744 [Papaver somniferum]